MICWTRNQISTNRITTCRTLFLQHLPLYCLTLILLSAITHPALSAPPAGFSEVSGTLRGVGGVTPDGQSTYRIAIQTAPGVNGVEPSVSINYRSGRSFGSVGHGWALAAGQQSISRCRQTVAQDTAAAGVSYTANDRFCLNGNRLVLMTGSAYGAPMSTYRTEVADHKRIVAHNGSTALGPASFTVTDTNGVKYLFGSTADSRVEVSGGSAVVRTWLLSRVVDLYGNFMTYTYAQDTPSDQPTLQEIAYTGSSQHNARYKVKFYYDDTVADSRHMYEAGGVVKYNQRLERIETLYNSSAVRKYYFDYDDAAPGVTKRNKLIKVTGCAVSGSQLECQKPIDVDWEYAASGWSAGDDLNEDLTGDRYMVGDWDGDGLHDVFTAVPTTGDQAVWHLSLGSSEYGDPPINTFIPAHEIEVVTQGQFPIIKYYRYELMDFNGDGRQDILRMKQGANVGNWEVYESMGIPATGFIYSIKPTGITREVTTRTFQIADFDGDGLDDIFYAKQASNTTAGSLGVFRNTGATFEPELELLSEFSTQLPNGDSAIASPEQLCCALRLNNDGRADLLVRLTVQNLDACTSSTCFESRWAYMSSTGTGFEVYHWGSRDSSRQWEVALDANGDGLDDLSHFGDGTQHFLEINNGSGFLAGEAVTLPPSDGGISEIGITDFNGDGRSDRAIRSGNGKLWILQSTGVDFELLPQLGPIGTNLYFADLDGDGFDDILEEVTDASENHPLTMPMPDDPCASTPGCSYTTPPLPVLPGAAGSLTRFRAHVSPYSDVVDKVTDGFGNYSDYDYEAIADSGAYSQDRSTIVTPYMIPAWSGKHVVVSHKMNDGVVPQGGTSQGSYNIGFYYKNALVETTGRGYLGFAKTVRTDSRNSVSTVTDYFQAFPKTGLIDLQTIVQPGNLTIRSTDYGWADDSLSTQTPPRRFVYMSESTETLHDVDNDMIAPNTNGDAVKSTKTTYTYATTDNKEYGQMTQELREIFTPPTASTPAFTIKTHYQPAAASTTNWCLNLFSSVTVSRDQTVGEVGTSNRTTSFVPDSTFCRYDGTTLFSTAPVASDRSVIGYSYNSRGGLSGQTLTSGAGTASMANGEAFQARIQSIEYSSDDDFHYPTYVNQCVGETSPSSCTHAGSDDPSRSLNWDRSLGLLSSQEIYSIDSETDDDVVRTFDRFGRLLSVAYPGGEAETLVYEDCVTAADCWSHSAVSKVEITTLSGSERNVYFDSLGRPVASERAVFRLTVNASRWLREETTYDQFGRVHVRTNPYFIDSSLYYVPQVLNNVFSYDLVGRVVGIDRPIDRVTTSGRTTTLAYNSLSRKRFDAEQRETSMTYDGLGRLVSSVDEGGSTISYVYDQWDSLKETTNSTDMTKITAGYDARGRRTSLTDPNRGLTEFKFDPAGAVIWQKDAKQQVTYLKYDELGRLTELDQAGQISKYEYYDNKTSHNGFTQLKSHEKNPGSSDVKVTYEYDTLGRRTKESTFIPSIIDFPAAGTFELEIGYDGFGRMDEIIYPKGLGNDRLKVDYAYSKGYLSSITDQDDSSRVFYTVDGLDVWEQPIRVTLGNGIRTQNIRDIGNSWLEFSESVKGSSEPTQAYFYTYDKVGNLIGRDQLVKGLYEAYGYDQRYRLDTAVVAGCSDPSCNLDVDYFDNGNIESKSDAAGPLMGSTSTLEGIYEYDGTTGGGPNAVSRILNGTGVVATFLYDANGNMTSRDGQSILWTAFDKPYEINKGTAKSELYYDANNTRFRQVESLGSTKAETLYVSGLFERHASVLLAGGAPVTGYRSYIMANGERVATVSQVESVGSTDGDAIPDGSDNCALTDNPNQMDSDGDGFGNACDADLNNDGATNYLDLYIFTQAMTEFQNGIAYDPDCDMDANGAINFIDYGMVTSNMGMAPGPALHTNLGDHVEYYQKDHLGSITSITDENGEVIAEFSFDAFGRQRDPSNWTFDDDLVERGLEWTATTRGYTDHEQLRVVELTHMNGRVYDPLIGRVISADPFVPDPTSTQSFNRYSYVVNNPLRYTDPSGYDFVDQTAALFGDSPTGPTPHLGVDFFGDDSITNRQLSDGSTWNYYQTAPTFESEGDLPGTSVSPGDNASSTTGSGAPIDFRGRRFGAGPVIQGLQLVGSELNGYETAGEAALAAFRYYEDAYQETGRNLELTGGIYRNTETGRFYFTEAALTRSSFSAYYLPLGNDLYAFYADFHTHPGRENQEAFSRLVDLNQDAIRRRFLRTPKGAVRFIEIEPNTRYKKDLPGRSVCPGDAATCLRRHRKLKK